jgi:hypothetical protein
VSIHGDFTFDEGDANARWEVVEIHTNGGHVFSDEDGILDNLDVCDQLFYTLTVGDATYYRWVAGPFEDSGDIGNAIEDETDFYEALAG